MKIVIALILIGVLGFFGYNYFINNQASTQAGGYEEGVLVLSDGTFEQALKDHEHLLVEFYAPWCGHCKKLAPEFAQAAQALQARNSTFVLAKIDATQNSEYAQKFDVKGYPTLLHFHQGEKADYNGERSAVGLLKFAGKKTGDFYTTISTVEQLAAFKENRVGVALFQQKAEGEKWEVFRQIGMESEAAVFGLVTSQEVATAAEAKFGDLVLFKTFDEKRNNFSGEFNKDAINAFIDGNRIPTIVEFNDEAIAIVFQSKLATLMLFQNDNEQSNAARQLLDQLAVSQKGNGLIFSYVTPSNQHYTKLAEFLGVNHENAPQFCVVDTRNERIDKFVFTQEINEANLNAYVEGFKAGTLVQSLKTEEIPTTQEGPVKVLVGKSFQQEVIDSDKDVLVKFYAPWCGHCKSLTPHWEEAAQKLAGNPNIVIAKLDSTLNEVAGVDIQGFPTLKFWKNGSKDTPIEYGAGRTTEDILNWLQQNTSHPWIALEQEKQEEVTSEQASTQNEKTGDL